MAQHRTTPVAWFQPCRPMISLITALVLFGCSGTSGGSTDSTSPTEDIVAPPKDGALDTTTPSDGDRPDAVTVDAPVSDDGSTVDGLVTVDVAQDGAIDGAPDLPVDMAPCDPEDCACAGLGSCGGDCVDLLSDPAHCGSCDFACPEGAICVEGICACGPGTAFCGTSCADILSDPDNCGGCGVECPVDSTCQNGSCTCSEELEMCGETCTNTLVDPANCGVCGQSCPIGGFCSQGECVCPPNKVECAGECVGLSYDPNHCGECGRVCGADEVCLGSNCVCPGIEQKCGDYCVNLSKDNENCGVCGEVCPETLACVEGACVTPPPRPVSPLSTARVTSQTPTFSWFLPGVLDGGRLEICEDRTCSVIVQSHDVMAESFTLETPLPAGTLYWRMFSLIDGEVGPVSSPIWQLRVGALTTEIDSSFGITTDPNRDGYADAVVGVCGFGALGCANVAHLYRSGPAGLDTEDPVILTTPTGNGGFGGTLNVAGDVNGDGYPDVVVGDYFGSSIHVFFGNANGLDTDFPQTVNFFGAALSVAGVGDLNRDGYGDVAIGLPLQSSVLVFLGAEDGLTSEPAASLNTGGLTMMGLCVDGAGDINGDGFADIIAGAPLSGGETAFIFLGTADGVMDLPSYSISGTDQTMFGASVAGAGDLNNDGYADVAIGAPEGNEVRIYYGSAAGIDPLPTIITGPQNTGLSVSQANDVNQDGYDDLAVSARATLFIYHGGPDGVSTTPAFTFEGEGNSLGNFVASPGDIDNDGYADVLIGEHDLKQAHGFRGGPSGLLDPPAFLLLGSETDNGFGWVVATIEAAFSTAVQ